MKAIRVILLVALATACVSCGSMRKSQESKQKPQQEFALANPQEFKKVEVSRIRALSVETGTGEIRAYGQALSPNEQMAISMARSQAVAALQSKIETYVRAAWDQYTEVTGVNNQYGMDENARAQVITAVKGIVAGADDVDFDVFYNSTDRVYKCEYCVKYNKAGVMSVMSEHSKRIKDNEKQFEEDVQHAWDYLDQKNNKEVLGEE